MAIPDYQTIMKPLLEFLKKHPGPQRMQDVIEALSSHFSLSETEKEILLPSGQQNVINNRVGWARTYLKKAGLLDDPKRGYVEINEKGLSVLSKNPENINVKYLNQFKDFQEFRKKRKNKLMNQIKLRSMKQMRVILLQMKWLKRDLNLLMLNWQKSFLER